jgi:hypothetical protein
MAISCLAVGKAIKQSGIPRNEIFVTSKLWNNKHHPDDVGPTDSNLSAIARGVSLGLCVGSRKFTILPCQYGDILLLPASCGTTSTILTMLDPHCRPAWMIWVWNTLINIVRMVLVVPQLAGNKNLVPGYAALLYSFTDSNLKPRLTPLAMALRLLSVKL